MESGGVGLSSTPGETESIPLQSQHSPLPLASSWVSQAAPAISPSVVSGPAAPGSLLELQTLGSCPRPAGSDPQVVLMSIGIMEPLSIRAHPAVTPVRHCTCTILWVSSEGWKQRGETPRIANPHGKWKLILGLPGGARFIE